MTVQYRSALFSMKQAAARRPTTTKYGINALMTGTNRRSKRSNSGRSSRTAATSMAIGNRKSPPTNNPRKTRFRTVFVSHIFSHVTPLSLKNARAMMNGSWTMKTANTKVKIGLTMYHKNVMLVPNSISGSLSTACRGFIDDLQIES